MKESDMKDVVEDNARKRFWRTLAEVLLVQVIALGILAFFHLYYGV